MVNALLSVYMLRFLILNLFHKTFSSTCVETLKVNTHDQIHKPRRTGKDFPYQILQLCYLFFYPLQNFHHIHWQRFTEKQAKILREIRKKLQSAPKESELGKEPVPITKARMLYGSCLDSATTDKLQFDALFHFLKEFSLPKVRFFDKIRLLKKNLEFLGAFNAHRARF